MFNHIRYGLLILYCFLWISNATFAQLPQCSGGGPRYIYFANNFIQIFDPSKPKSATNPVTSAIPLYVGALAISPNLNAASPSPTFYSINGTKYIYWDGSQWINTGHDIGAPYANNIGAGGGYIYSFDAQNGDVYRYNGTGNAIFIASVAGFSGGGPFDIVADCDGNFYILQLSSPQFVRQYNLKGVLQQQWNVTGAPYGPGGGGVAMIDNKMYFEYYGTYYVGTVNPTNNSVDFLPLQVTPIGGVQDFASCPVIALNTQRVKANNNPAYYCGSGPATPIKAVGSKGIFSWSVLSGPATISHTTGDSTSVISTDSAKILLTYYDTLFCGIKGTDTVNVVVPKATLDAGLPKHLTGCGTYIDSLSASLTNMTFGVNYNVTWTPASSITIPGPNKLKPIITPTSNTTYTITVRTASNQGGCTWSDTVSVTVEDLRVGTTDFEYTIDYGCTADIVNFINKSTTSIGALTYQWIFGDSSGISTQTNPAHTYKRQDVYHVSLVADNGICRDTVTKEISTLHPLKAAFTADNNIFCTNKPVQFNSNITVASQTPAPPSYRWNFGDGQSGTGPDPQHRYSVPGKYKVILTVTDFVPCTDTTSMVLDNFIDPPYIEVGPEDTTLCEGELLYLPVGLSIRGISYIWSTGSTSPNITVSEEGRYFVELHNDCGVSTDTITVTFNDCSVWMPDIFSPNGDNLNDILRFRSKYPEEISGFSFAIYNRKGNRVFYTEDINHGWDGSYHNTPQPIGTYYYMIQLTLAGAQRFLKGDITLAR
ncbi:MAG: PKD domain-containing protein [Chitinophagaceae bacterium]|nr:PKD domain-containing protein [Chitinophagaceae bacterium]